MINAVLLLSMILLYNFQSVFCKLYTQSREQRGNLHFSVIYGLITGIVTLFIASFSYRPSLLTFCLGLTNAVILLLYNTSLQKASSLGSYAFMMVCSLSGAILLPMFYEVLFQGQVMAWYRIAGIAAIIAAGVLMNLEGFHGKKTGKFLAWTALLSVSNGMYGVIMNLQQEKMAFAQRNEMIITTFLGMSVLTLISGIIKDRKPFLEDFRMEKRSWIYLLASGICAVTAVNLLLYSLQCINPITVHAVNNGGLLIVSAVMAVFLFKEKLKWNSILGVAVSLIGVIMLTV